MGLLDFYLTGQTPGQDKRVHDALSEMMKYRATLAPGPDRDAFDSSPEFVGAAKAAGLPTRRDVTVDPHSDQPPLSFMERYRAASGPTGSAPVHGERIVPPDMELSDILTGAQKSGFGKMSQNKDINELEGYATKNLPETEARGSFLIQRKRATQQTPGISVLEEGVFPNAAMLKDVIGGGENAKVSDWRLRMDDFWKQVDSEAFDRDVKGKPIRKLTGLKETEMEKLVRAARSHSADLLEGQMDVTPVEEHDKKGNPTGSWTVIINPSLELQRAMGKNSTLEPSASKKTMTKEEAISQITSKIEEKLGGGKGQVSINPLQPQGATVGGPGGQKAWGTVGEQPISDFQKRAEELKQLMDIYKGINKKTLVPIQRMQ